MASYHQNKSTFLQHVCNLNFWPNLGPGWIILFYFYIYNLSIFYSWKKNQNTKKTLLRKSAFHNFLTSGSAQIEHVKLAVIQHFQFKHFPMSKINSKSRSLEESYIIIIKFRFINVLINIRKKSRLRDTLNLSTNADRSTNTKKKTEGGGVNQSIFLKKEFMPFF